MDEDTITIPLYELITEGQSVNGWKLRGRSKIVYLDRQAAAEHIESFEEKWYDETQFECAVKGTLETTIFERDLKVSPHVLERILRDYKKN